MTTPIAHQRNMTSVFTLIKQIDTLENTLRSLSQSETTEAMIPAIEGLKKMIIDVRDTYEGVTHGKVVDYQRKYSSSSSAAFASVIETYSPKIEQALQKARSDAELLKEKLITYEYTYTIKPGDTLSKLALRFHTTVDDLCKRNGIKNPDLIHADAKLIIPVSLTTVIAHELIKNGISLAPTKENKTDNQSSTNNHATDNTVTVKPNPSPNPTDSGNNLTVPQRQWIPSTPKNISDESNRSPENYNNVIEQFDVTHNIRYTRNTMDGKSKKGVTWCNIFAWDVTKAMGAEIPHWYDPVTGEPTAVGAKGAKEMGTTGMNQWMDQFGSKFGWREMTAAEAQAAANSGKPTVALSTGHVAMVVPSESGYNPIPNGPRITQAGASNFENGTTKGGFGREYSQVRYFTHD